MYSMYTLGCFLVVPLFNEFLLLIIKKKGQIHFLKMQCGRMQLSYNNCFLYFNLRDKAF